MSEPSIPVRGPFPSTRMRRNRRHPWIRNLVSETSLSSEHLIWPLFVCEGVGVREPVPSMPGVYRYSVDLCVEQVALAISFGISAVALFPKTPLEKKTNLAEEATNPHNLICTTLRVIRATLGDKIGLVADVALDPYTSHGHDGLVVNDYVVNDQTLDILCRQAVVQADAGASVIAPSDMMDGRIGSIRNALDDSGHHEVLLMSYAAKYASAFYGPFRDAVGSAGSLGKATKKTYQMDPAASDEALHEVALDLQEGADIIMVKPGMPYLDIVRRIKDTFAVPVAIYQVSGEYAMLTAAAQNGWLDRQSVVLESLLSMRRAGGNMILTYFALEAAHYLRGEIYVADHVS